MPQEMTVQEYIFLNLYPVYSTFLFKSYFSFPQVLLVEARSGADQARWPVKSLKKWFVARENVRGRQDRDKIVVIITHK